MSLSRVHSVFFKKTSLLSTLLCLILVVVTVAFNPSRLHAVKQEITVAAVGDCIISQKVSVLTDPSFLELVQLLRKADCTYGNCETTFCDPEECFPGWKNYQDPNVFCHPFGAAELKWMGIDLVSLANNHIMDFDYKGLFSTLENLDRAGIAYAGAGKNLDYAAKAGYTETAGGIVGLVSCCATIAEMSAQATAVHPHLQGKPGLNPLNLTYLMQIDRDTFSTLRDCRDKIYAGLGEIDETAENDQKDKIAKPEPEILDIFEGEIKFKAGDKIEFQPQANKKDLARIDEMIRISTNNSRIVIVSIHEHMGIGRDPKPTGYEIEFAHQCIDSGADIFIGTGPHILWGLEIYKGKPIFYSIGNFFFQTLRLISADAYERLDLPADSKDPMVFPEKFFKYFKGYAAWESIVPIITFDSEDKVKDITLYPIVLEKDVPLHRSGTPQLARGEKAADILARFQKLSADMNTKIVISKGVGKVVF